MANHSLCVKWSLLRSRWSDTEGEEAARNMSGVHWQVAQISIPQGFIIHSPLKPPGLCPQGPSRSPAAAPACGLSVDPRPPLHPLRSLWAPWGHARLSFLSQLCVFKIQSTGNKTKPRSSSSSLNHREAGCGLNLALASPCKRELKHGNSSLLAQLSLLLEMQRFSINISHRCPNQHRIVLLVCFLGSESIS